MGESEDGSKTDLVGEFRNPSNSGPLAMSFPFWLSGGGVADLVLVMIGSSVVMLAGSSRGK